MIWEEMASLRLWVLFSSVWASFSSRLSPGSSKEGSRSSSLCVFSFSAVGGDIFFPNRKSQRYVHWPDYWVIVNSWMHSQWPGTYRARIGQAWVMWPGIGAWYHSHQTTWPEGRGSSKENQCLEEGRTAGQIKAHHLHKHRLECRDKASKRVPSGWLRQGEHEAFQDKKDILSHWKEQERNDGKWGGGMRINFVDLASHV